MVFLTCLQTDGWPPRGVNVEEVTSTASSKNMLLVCIMFSQMPQTPQWGNSHHLLQHWGFSRGPWGAALHFKQSFCLKFTYEHRTKYAMGHILRMYSSLTFHQAYSAAKACFNLCHITLGFKGPRTIQAQTDRMSGLQTSLCPSLSLWSQVEQQTPKAFPEHGSDFNRLAQILTCQFRSDWVIINLLNNKEYVKSVSGCWSRHPYCRVSTSVKGREWSSHALVRCTVGYFYSPTSAVIYIFHICTHDYAYIGSATDIHHTLFTRPTFPYDW